MVFIRLDSTKNYMTTNTSQTDSLQYKEYTVGYDHHWSYSFNWRNMTNTVVICNLLWFECSYICGCYGCRIVDHWMSKKKELQRIEMYYIYRARVGNFVGEYSWSLLSEDCKNVNVCNSVTYEMIVRMEVEFSFLLQHTVVVINDRVRACVNGGLDL